MYERYWEVTFPLSLGYVPLLVVDTTHILGDGVTKSQDFVSLGTFQPLDGYFTLWVEGESTEGEFDC